MLTMRLVEFLFCFDVIYTIGILCPHRSDPLFFQWSGSFTGSHMLQVRHHLFAKFFAFINKQNFQPNFNIKKRFFPIFRFSPNFLHFPFLLAQTENVHLQSNALISQPSTLTSHHFHHHSVIIRLQEDHF